MRLAAMIAVVAVGAVLGSGGAAAACRDDVKEFTAKVAVHPKQGDQKAVQKEMGKAQDLSTWDESGCFNALARAKRAFSVQPPAEAAEKSVQPVQPLNQPLDQPLNRH